MASKQATLIEIPAGADPSDAMRRELNRGLMVSWINRDLLNRADCDVRKSVVFYDADRVFMMALSAEVTPAGFRERLETLPNAIAAARRLGARYWSAGVV
jgi:hypothetical protein